ncbi:outer membrane protein assembly factor BamB family protein [Actinomadura hibisca]|uniref:outer membrane protein assembly factor BamB family protein n=1 Tax=Actinomadura hibisca TaxID=68565 RepID=UPI00082CBC80|nr:PQQ-binding-like beta-propeller repeat protein [Actinomadura hibisca]
MGGGRWRLLLGAVAGALAAAVCAVLVGRFVLGAEWWQVKHEVTGEPAVRLAELGPPPGPLTVTWQRSARVHRGPVAGYDNVAYAVAQGQVVTATGRGLEVRDARTGGDRWSYRRKGWTLLGWAATGDRLLGYFERDGHRDERQMVAFDALSGGLLWRRSGERPAALGRTTLRWPAGSGVVLTTSAHREAVFGRSATTGAKLWKLRLPAGCRLYEDAPHPADGAENLSALALDCDGPTRLMALDPATGKVRWSEPLGSDESPEVAVLDGVTLVADASALRAYDQDGTRFAHWNGDVCGDTMCPGVLAGGGRLIVMHRPEGARPGTARMEAVEIGKGRVAWRRDVPDYAALARAADQVYALRPRLADRLLPAGVDVITPADGATTTVPAPFALDPDLRGVRPWLTAAGGLLFVAVPEAAPRPDGAGRLVALRGGPPGAGPNELGGTRPQDWPDACGLLTKEDLAAVGLENHTARPRHTQVGSVKLPRAVSCAYTLKTPPPTADPDERDRENPEWGTRDLTVTVRWTAPTAASASALLDALQATQSQARQRTDLGGDEAYELGPTAGTVALRVDRVIVVVNVAPPAAAPRLARAVATTLRS